MSKITLDEVKKLAALARINITDEEAAKFQAEISSILEYVDKLNAIDTSDVKPTSQVTGLVNVTRSDEVVDYGVDQSGLLMNAPDSISPYIRVKKVL